MWVIFSNIQYFSSFFLKITKGVLLHPTMATIMKRMPDLALKTFMNVRYIVHYTEIIIEILCSFDLQTKHCQTPKTYYS